MYVNVRAYVTNRLASGEPYQTGARVTSILSKGKSENLANVKVLINRTHIITLIKLQTSSLIAK